ncbi:hypothetical protein ATANTOWER_025855 [Ataeniobius toweri]|uniref:Uncharacterized protein n=1 Tax=Ataeniobius toweri TaxID=208326 RepID=A0ABU7ABC3_9TELE|nr:hypothetical protein [Ataeniobius toweri]
MILRGECYLFPTNWELRQSSSSKVYPTFHPMTTGESHQPPCHPAKISGCRQWMDGFMCVNTMPKRKDIINERERKRFQARRILCITILRAESLSHEALFMKRAL